MPPILGLIGNRMSRRAVATTLEGRDAWRPRCALRASPWYWVVALLGAFMLPVLGCGEEARKDTRDSSQLLNGLWRVIDLAPWAAARESEVSRATEAVLRESKGVVKSPFHQISVDQAKQWLAKPLEARIRETELGMKSETYELEFEEDGKGIARIGERDSSVTTRFHWRREGGTVEVRYIGAADAAPSEPGLRFRLDDRGGLVLLEPTAFSGVRFERQLQRESGR